MRLQRLEVQDFRSIRAATIAFGPGLTVVYGPNELGKSTIVEAIHAALFLQATSQAGNEHVTWGCSTPPCVKLTFEHQGKLWRVSKQFGPKPLAKLETSENGESPKFREVLTGKGVEGRLRELLAWGIAPPGGKGAAPKVESFLLTALLGRQGEVQKVLGACLENDRDDSGKSLVTQALGALDKDPLVGQIHERLATQIDAVFTSQGNLKTAADSPLVKLQQHLRTQQDLLETLQQDESKGRVIQANVVRLQDERERLLAELASAEATWVEARDQAERERKKATLQNEIDDLRRQITEADRLTAELASVDSQLATVKSNLLSLESDEAAAGATLEATREQLQAAAEAVVREREAAAQSARVQKAARAQRRAELEGLRMAAEARLHEVSEAEQAASEVARVEQELKQASDAREVAFERVKQAERGVEQAKLRERLAGLSARESEVTRAAALLAEAKKQEQFASARLQDAAAAVSDAEDRRERGQAETESKEIEEAAFEVRLLQAVEAHIGLAKLRAEVQALEDSAAHARTLRSHAQTRRSEATGIDQRVASRVLPTREQIAAWRALEKELDSVPVPTSASRSPILTVALTFAVAFAAVATAAHLGLGWPVATALLTGFTAAVIVGGSVWVGVRTRARTQFADYERRARHNERWAQEVQPSLSAAGLSTLGAYEDALADLERLKVEAQGLRDLADREDHAAAESERSAAPLESRRKELARLERETAADHDVATVSARAEAYTGDVDNVRLRIQEVQGALETTRGRLRAHADAAVKHAEDQRAIRQAEYDAAAKGLTAAETTLTLARQTSDPEEAARLRARLAAIKEEAPASNVVEASKALDEAREQQTTALAKADSLRARLDEMRPRLQRLVSGLGGDPVLARQQAQQGLDEIAIELAGLDTSGGTDPTVASAALDSAGRSHEALKQQFADDNARLESASKSRSDVGSVLRALETDAAVLRGSLAAINRPALESRLQKASSSPVLQSPEGPQIDPAAAQALFEALKQQLDRCTNDLNHARGQLHLIAGHVGAERLAQQQEAVSLAHAETLERERTERAARRLLCEIESVEGERATHLGRALAGPITEAFRALTGGRYGPIALNPDLKTEHIEASGGQRALNHLSFGTREQLATLLRLVIAGHLRTAVVLDDQLVHSDSERLAWFSERLLESAHQHDHQVIIFTCRPGDYLPREAGGVTTVDLASLVSR